VPTLQIDRHNMIRQTITIINKLGLHTRAAAKLVATATQFESKIQISRNNQLADCKSIMSLILMGVTKNMTLELIISGADEMEARDAIVNLIQNRFGEAE
jgi:phosphocarrier protein HPr